MELHLEDFETPDFSMNMISRSGSCYNTTVDVVHIDLRQVLKHAVESGISIENALIHHTAHESIHSLVNKYVGRYESRAFDNIASIKSKRLYGRFTLRTWFSGFERGKMKCQC